MPNMPSKRILKIVGISVGVVLVLILALPLFINVDTFRPKIESELTGALGRPVSLGKMSLSILSGSVGVEKISIADDPAFSNSPFITAKSLNIGVEVMPLIFSKQLNITEIVLEEPQITLLKAANGKWNFATLGGAAAKKAPAPDKSGSPQNLSVGKLEIKDGKLIVGQSTSAKPQVYEKLNVEVKNFSFNSRFPFELTINLPGGGSADLNGKAGPINPQDSAKTPFDAVMKVKEMDLAASGFVEASTGIGGSADFDGTLSSDGSQAKAAGTVTCEKLKLSPKGSPAPKAIAIKYAVNADLNNNSGSITQGDVTVGKAAAKLTGGFQTQGATTVVNMKLSAPNMPVDDLEAMLPAMGIVLPSGSKLQGGTLSAELSISGPMDKLVIAGPVRMSNSKLAGFDMGAKLGALSAFTGKAPSSKDTTIQNASLNAHIAPDITRTDSINVSIPALGVVTGAGTISPAGALDFHMVADVQTGRSEARNDRGGIPFMIQGTTSNPSFVPDVAGIATGALKNAVSGKAGSSSNPVGAITGIFGRKKK